MKTKNLVTKTILKSLIVSGLIVSCAFASMAFGQEKKPNNQSKQTRSKGPINGGGGYVCTNSKVVLENASTQLANQLNAAADIVFSKLPSGWTRERLVHLVKTVRLADEHTPTPNTRNNKRLRFDFGTDAEGQYITALEPFCYTYESTPIDFESPVQLDKTYRQIQLEMLHEIAHHMGIGITEATDSDARAFAREVLNRLTNHFVACDFPEKANQDLFPNMRNSAFQNSFVFANLVNLEISVEMPDSQNSVQTLLYDKDGILTNSMYANFAVKIKKGDFFNLERIEAPKFNFLVSEYLSGSTKVIEIPNTSDLRTSKATEAKMTLTDSKNNVARVFSGICLTLAKPIEMNKAKGK